MVVKFLPRMNKMNNSPENLFTKAQIYQSSGNIHNYFTNIVTAANLNHGASKKALISETLKANFIVKFYTTQMIEFLESTKHYSWSATLLAVAYIDEYVVKKNLEVAHQLLQEAVTNKNCWAMNILAYSYEVGRHVESDVNKAVNLYESALAYGCGIAMFSLVELYMHDKSVRNIPRAIELYKLAANKGNAGSMYKLAYIYECQGNYMDAEYWYKMAYDKGNSNALDDLISMYSKHTDKFNMVDVMAYIKKHNPHSVYKLFTCAQLVDIVHGYYMYDRRFKLMEKIDEMDETN